MVFHYTQNKVQILYDGFLVLLLHFIYRSFLNPQSSLPTFSSWRLQLSCFSSLPMSYSSFRAYFKCHLLLEYFPDTQCPLPGSPVRLCAPIFIHAFKKYLLSPIICQTLIDHFAIYHQKLCFGLLPKVMKADSPGHQPCERKSPHPE